MGKVIDIRTPRPKRKPRPPPTPPVSEWRACAVHQRDDGMYILEIGEDTYEMTRVGVKHLIVELESALEETP